MYKIQDITPHGFSNLDDFTAAFIDRRLSQFEKVRPYHDHQTAQAIKRNNEKDAEYAREDAFEIWWRHVDNMEELYNRGVGPSWD